MQDGLVAIALPELLMLLIPDVQRLSHQIVPMSPVLPLALQGHLLASMALRFDLLVWRSIRWVLTKYLLKAAVITLCSWVILTLIIWMNFHNVAMPSAIWGFELLLRVILLVDLLWISGFTSGFLGHSIRFLVLASSMHVHLPLLLHFWVLNESLRAVLWSTGWCICMTSDWLEIQCLRDFVWSQVRTQRGVATASSIIWCVVLRTRGDITLCRCSLVVSALGDKLLRWSTLPRVDY